MKSNMRGGYRTSLKKLSRFCLLSFAMVSALTPERTKFEYANNKLNVDRREALTKSIASGMVYSGIMASSSFLEIQTVEAATTKNIADLLNAETLTMPPSGRASEFQGVDNTYFPSWMEGEWDVRQTLTSCNTPLGLKFLGGPNGSEEIAMKTIAEQKEKIGIPVNLQLRWAKTKWGVCEDRVFNLRQRLDAFAGRKVVASVEYADVGGSNRKSVLNLGGKESDPLQTTVVYYRGPAAQKTFLLSHDEESVDAGSWAAYETTRSIFALTNTNTAPPITTDSQVVWYLEKLDDNTVKGKLRLADYLNAQSDTLYFESRNRAVSISDYTLELKKVI